MGDRARRDPELDVWRERIAEELRAHMARRRLTGADGARALGMDQATFSRKMLGKVSFSAEEILKLSNWMNRHVDEVLAAAYNGATNPCLSHSDDPSAQSRVTDWAKRGYELARRLYGDRVDVRASAA